MRIRLNELKQLIREARQPVLNEFAWAGLDRLAALSDDIHTSLQVRDDDIRALIIIKSLKAGVTPEKAQAYLSGYHWNDWILDRTEDDRFVLVRTFR